MTNNSAKFHFRQQLQQDCQLATEARESFYQFTLKYGQALNSKPDSAGLNHRQAMQPTNQLVAGLGCIVTSPTHTFSEQVCCITKASVSTTVATNTQRKPI